MPLIEKVQVVIGAQTTQHLRGRYSRRDERGQDLGVQVFLAHVLGVGVWLSINQSAGGTIAVLTPASAATRASSAKAFRRSMCA